MNNTSDDTRRSENVKADPAASTESVSSTPASCEKVLTPAAQRALAEAAERRAAAEAQAKAAAKDRGKEYNGPQGPEPTRYGDWERKGIASDF